MSVQMINEVQNKQPKTQINSHKVEYNKDGITVKTNWEKQDNDSFQISDRCIDGDKYILNEKYNPDSSLDYLSGDYSTKRLGTHVEIHTKTNDENINKLTLKDKIKYLFDGKLPRKIYAQTQNGYLEINEKKQSYYKQYKASSILKLKGQTESFEFPGVKLDFSGLHFNPDFDWENLRTKEKRELKSTMEKMNIIV